MPVALFPPTLSRALMGSQETPDTADWVVVGLPYDGTTSNRPGTRFGPAAIREASWGLEGYSPTLDRDLEDVRFFDAGDLELPLGNRDACLAVMGEAARAVLSAGQRWVGLGGEHLATLPVIEAYLERYPDLGVIHFDAHADLREDYLGEALSHATVLRRVVDCIGPERLVQGGIRSGPRDEFAWMRAQGTLATDLDDFRAKLAARMAGRPVFLTLDLDVLDPSILPGTGTPEPGGWSFSTLLAWLSACQGLNFVGADLMELSPHYDPSGVSSAVAAKAWREVQLLVAG